ncbi:hypothetical protein ACET3X_001865 [Alternaria dauci]|uniref:Uncharacterized protein n=1 Tax=Alternaria dauci TaxID=48095 RepID=A0ABR3UZI5_9PLEO
MFNNKISRNKRGKMVVCLSGLNDIRLGTPAHPPTKPPIAAAPKKLEPSITDYTFEQYKAANLNIDEQYDIIGKIRNELPIIDRDEVDNTLLRSIGQQFELAIFPTCKMMHVDPLSVKRMFDDQFRRAYGPEVEAEVLAKLGMCRLEDIEKAVTAVKAGNVTKEEDVERSTADLGEESKREEEHAIAPPPPKKKAKRAPPNDTQADLKAHIAKRRRAHRGCRILTLKSVAVSEKWEALSSAS